MALLTKMLLTKKNVYSNNPFLNNVSILHPLKTPKRFSGVFGGYKMGTLARNGLKLRYLLFLIFAKVLQINASLLQYK